MSQLTFYGEPAAAKLATPAGESPLWPEAEAVLRAFRGEVVTDFPECDAAVMHGAPEKEYFGPNVYADGVPGPATPDRGREAANRKTFARSAKPRRAKRGGWNSF